MTERKTVDPELEPEYVGCHSGLKAEECQNWVGEEPEACGNEATHTMVLFSGTYHFMAVCDECGRPDEVASDRKWSGNRSMYVEEAPEP